MTRRIFFNQFATLFATYRMFQDGKTVQRAWADLDIAPKKVGPKKVRVKQVRIQATATFGADPNVRVDTIYLDDAGEEVHQGRSRIGLTLEYAHAECEARVGKLGV